MTSTANSSPPQSSPLALGSPSSPKVISIISGKGGTGKSTASAGISLALAHLGKSVLLIDMDLGLRSLDIMLGMENKVVFDLGDVLAKRCSFHKAPAAHDSFDKLKLLCSPLTIGDEFDINEIIELIQLNKQVYEYVVLDLPAGVGLSVILAKALSEMIVIVTTPEAVTVRDSRKICDIVSKDSKIPLRLLINRVSREGMRLSKIKDLDEVLDMIGVPLLGVLKEDKWVKSVILNQNPHQLSRSNAVFDAIAKRLDGEYVPLVIRSC